MYPFFWADGLEAFDGHFEVACALEVEKCVSCPECMYALTRSSDFYVCSNIAFTLKVEDRLSWYHSFVGPLTERILTWVDRWKGHKCETFIYARFLETNFLKLRCATIAKTGSNLSFSENSLARCARGHVLISRILCYDKPCLRLV